MMWDPHSEVLQNLSNFLNQKTGDISF